jgi:hypothetical protein
MEDPIRGLRANRATGFPACCFHGKTTVSTFPLDFPA